MGKIKQKQLPQFYLNIAKTMNEAAIKVSMRITLGYVLTEEENNALWEVHSVFFPGQELSDDGKQMVLRNAASIMVDAWAGVPVSYLPAVDDLQEVDCLVRQLRNIPLHFGERSARK